MRLATVASAPIPARARPQGLAERPISDSEIDQLAHGLHGASSFAAGAPRLLSALLDPALGIDSLAALISAEPGVAIRVLRVANSSFYGHAGGVASVTRATQVLGLQALRGIAAAACFGGLSIPPRGKPGLDMGRFRRHSLATACAAQGLALRTAPGQADEAFMAGLLHDLGQLVQWWLRPQEMAWLAETVPAAERWRAEAAWLGASHAHCGQRLLAAWQLPASLVSAIAAQGAEPLPIRQTEPDLTTLLGLADRLAADVGHVVEGDELTVPLPEEGALAEACAAVAGELPAALQRLGSAVAD